MIPFAVWHDGIPDNTEGQQMGRWVLAVDDDEAFGGKLLLSNDDGSLYWRPMADCKLIRVHTPDNAIAVVPVQVPQQNGLVIAEPNRMMRRHSDN